MSVKHGSHFGFIQSTSADIQSHGLVSANSGHAAEFEDRVPVGKKLADAHCLRPNNALLSERQDWNSTPHPRQPFCLCTFKRTPVLNMKSIRRQFTCTQDYKKIPTTCAGCNSILAPSHEFVHARCNKKTRISQFVGLMWHKKQRSTIAG